MEKTYVQTTFEVKTQLYHSSDIYASSRTEIYGDDISKVSLLIFIFITTKKGNR